MLKGIVIELKGKRTYSSSRALGFKQAMPIQVPKSPVPPFPEKSSRMYKQHNDI